MTILGISIYVWITVFLVMSLGSLLLAVRLLKDHFKR